MVFGTTFFNVAVRYRTPRDGYRTVHYSIPAEDKAGAIHTALMRARKIRGSTMHEAEVTLIA